MIQGQKFWGQKKTWVYKPQVFGPSAQFLKIFPTKCTSVGQDLIQQDPINFLWWIFKAWIGKIHSHVVYSSRVLFPILQDNVLTFTNERRSRCSIYDEQIFVHYAFPNISGEEICNLLFFCRFERLVKRYSILMILVAIWGRGEQMQGYGNGVASNISQRSDKILLRKGYKNILDALICWSCLVQKYMDITPSNGFISSNNFHCNLFSSY